MAFRSSSSFPSTLVALLLALCGPRAAEGRVGFQVEDLTSATWDNFINSNGRALVDFYDPSDEQWPSWNVQLQHAVRMVREWGSEVPIARVDINAEPELKNKYVLNGKFPQLMWFQHGEPTSYHRTYRKSKAIADFVLALDRDPIITVESEAAVLDYVNRALWAQVEKGSAAYKVLEVLALKHMDTMAVTFKDSNKNEIKWVADKDDTLGTHNNAVFEGEVTLERLERWVRGHLLRTEEMPPPQDGDSLSVIGSTFEDIVLQKDKDVFLLIFAPWCGWSRKFLPTWESLARRAAAVPHLVVAKMDGDRNGSPFPDDFSWQKYPTIFFVKAGTTTPVVFHGNRAEQALLEFAKQHGSNKTSEELDAAINGSSLVVSDNPEWEL